MNRFKLFKNCKHGFYIQLKQNDKGKETYWWIPDLHCANYCDVPEDFIGWSECEALETVNGFIGYITFKEFDDV